jgi:hypothetical protein
VIAENLEQNEPLKSPYPYFGGKRLVAPIIWKVFGNVQNFVVRARITRLIVFGLIPNFFPITASVPLPAKYSRIASPIDSSDQDLGRPVVFVKLLVDQRVARRLAAVPACALSKNSIRCSAKCSALLIATRLVMSSFNLFPSLWWITMPGSKGPLLPSQTNLDLRTHTLGSAILMKVLRSPISFISGSNASAAYRYSLLRNSTFYKTTIIVTHK